MCHPNFGFQAEQDGSDERDAVKQVERELRIFKKLHREQHENIAELIMCMKNEQLNTGYLLLKGNSGGVMS